MIPDHAMADRIFPRFVAGIAILAALLLLVQMLFRRPEGSALLADREVAESGSLAHGLWPTLLWFAGLLTMTALVGFVLALAVFLFAFIAFRAGRSFVFAAIYTALGIAFICAMAALLNRDFPSGLLQSAVRLPWPLT